MLAHHYFPELPKRESEVLALIAPGSSNKGLTEKLFIRMKTVCNHITDILANFK
jgi:DNA-binding NarL/FixJ family response regulator